MEPWLKEVIGGGTVGGIAGGAFALLLMLLYVALSPGKHCPGCGIPFPKLRKPTSFRQALTGGWTCPHCGCEVNWLGRKIKS